MIDLQDLRAWANVKNQTADDDMLVALEARVVAYVELVTGSYFGGETEAVEVLSGGAEPILWLSNLPSTGESAELAVETRTTLSSDWDEVEDTSYEVDGRKLVYLSESGWPSGTRNLRVTYDVGYTSGSEPGEIRQLVLGLVAAMYKGGRRDPADKPEAYLDQVAGAKETIERWRRVPV